MELFDDELKAWKEHVVPAQRSIYDAIIVDSNIERDFVKQLEHMDAVKLYVKLPRDFKVPTPIGNYNPDWAIVMEDPHDPTKERCYLIAETKGNIDTSKLQFTHEEQKINCGKAHFSALNVPYHVVKTVADIPDCNPQTVLKENNSTL